MSNQREPLSAVASNGSPSGAVAPSIRGSNWRALWVGVLAILALWGCDIAKADDVSARVKRIIVEHLGVEPGKVTDSAAFIDDLGADDLDTVELVMAFEEEFGCEIPDKAAKTIVTVGDAIKFLSACTPLSAPTPSTPQKSRPN